MENVEKDRPIPENPSNPAGSDAKKEEDDQPDQETNNPDAQKPELDADLTQKDEIDSSPSAEGAKPDLGNLEVVESEIINDGEESTETKAEEPPSLPPDLEKVSEEIDQYISVLSASKGDDSSPLDVPIFVEQFTVLVEDKIEGYDAGDSPVKWSKLTDEESASFLEMVTRVCSLQKSISEFKSEYKFAYSINRVEGVLQRAISYLEDEFKTLVEDYNILESDACRSNNDAKLKQSNSSISNPEAEQSPSPASVPAEDKKFPGYSPEILSNLVKLSKVMLLSGYEVECFHTYFMARRNALEESMHKLGFEKYSIDDVQKMGWDSLEKEIVAWIRTFNQFITDQFPRERELSDTVFSLNPSMSESLFGSLSHVVMIQLLNFAEAVALSKRAAEKLFKFLDMYEATAVILNTADNIFPEAWAGELKTETTMIRSHLGESMVLIFNELENSINNDMGKTPVPGGAVHPLTRYTMNYLEYACEYKETLEQVFKQHQKIERADSTNGSDFDYNAEAKNVGSEDVAKDSPFQSQMIKVMELLDSNLEGKSKLYKDPSLSMIFLMNNGRYILQKIKGSSEVNSLMGNTWCRKRSTDLRQYHKGYQRETWGKLLSCLHPEGLMVNGKVVKPVLKERFKSFNTMFDEIHKTQSSWVVCDEQLQSELRVSISNMVIPAYRSFLGRFSQVFTPGRQTEKYVKYQAEDIETYVDELFDGNAATPIGRRKV